MYLLQDEEGKLYIGSSKDLKRRIAEHKNGKVYTTQRMTDIKLIYYKSYLAEDLAREREKKLKQFGSAYLGLLKRLKLK